MTLGLATSTSVGIYGGQGGGLSLESYGGGGGGGGLGSYGSYGGGEGGSYGEHVGLSLGGGGGGGGSLYSGPSSYETSEHGGGSSSGGGGGSGDFHHGVSIVGGGGGDGHGATIDLTQHVGSESGPFGGTFIGSSKYEGQGQGGIAHKVVDGDGHGSLIAFGSPHYTDVLGAGGDEGFGGSLGGGGGGGGDYKWGFVELGDH